MSGALIDVRDTFVGFDQPIAPEAAIQAANGDDSIYVAIGKHEKVEPSPQAPNGWIDTYSLIRFDPDP